jgi:hypothetical protein
MHEPSLEGGLEGALVHPRHHKYPPRLGILDDGGDEALGVVFQWNIHGAMKRRMKKPDDPARGHIGT